MASAKSNSQVLSPPKFLSLETTIEEEEELGDQGLELKFPLEFHEGFLIKV